MKSLAGKTVLLCLCAVLTLTGCNKKKQATLPPQSQAPTVEAPQEPVATTIEKTEPATKEPTTVTPSTTTAEPAPSTAATTTKPKPKPRKPRNNNKPATSAGNGAASPASTTPPANGTPSQTSKVIVQQGGEPTGTVQISAAGPDEDVRSRQTIEQLLQSTDTNLRSISRQLDDNERAMVEQIRTYMAQARTASTDGDLTRANNLALKAHLLSDELVKR
jgi:hypothetical protein